MATFIRGDVVVLPFPFADNSGYKRRPALVLSAFSAQELIVCAITSQTVRDDYCIPLTPDDFESGSIKNDSYVRPNYVFTVRAAVIAYRAGKIKTEKRDEVVQMFERLMRT